MKASPGCPLQEPFLVLAWAVPLAEACLQWLSRPLLALRRAYKALFVASVDQLPPPWLHKVEVFRLHRQACDQECHRPVSDFLQVCLRRHQACQWVVECLQELRRWFLRPGSDRLLRQA